MIFSHFKLSEWLIILAGLALYISAFVWERRKARQLYRARDEAAARVAAASPAELIDAVTRHSKFPEVPLTISLSFGDLMCVVDLMARGKELGDLSDEENQKRLDRLDKLDKLAAWFEELEQKAFRKVAEEVFYAEALGA
jgi:hypothetical protein